ncbi:hypothetical protein BKA56DRAFT_618291 [Ilyonectria sp. MPI-CAGE-AT-0026]|nr:hypothetical protein BKA56DRAFT_618291 [Ilyonectria sp. MPI-CAGE-AT-0026]
MLPARILQLPRLDSLWFFLPWMRVVTAFTRLRAKLFSWFPGFDMAFGILAYRMAHRRVVRTDHWEEGGYIGLGLPLAQFGDTILICKGGKLPLIVRPNGNGEWSLLGNACYVHGVADGRKWEAFEQERRSGGNRLADFRVI